MMLDEYDAERRVSSVWHGSSSTSSLYTFTVPSGDYDEGSGVATDSPKGRYIWDAGVILGGVEIPLKKGVRTCKIAVPPFNASWLELYISPTRGEPVASTARNVIRNLMLDSNLHAFPVP